MVHDEPLAQCLKDHERFDEHIRESISVRDTITRQGEQVKTLQGVVTMLITDIKEIKDRLLERPPAWVGIVFTILGSICTGLIVYLTTH